jgi:hypothetical protein
MTKQPTPVNRSNQEIVNEGLALLWNTAKRVVAQIQSFQPDIVLSLLHSGWAPAKAALMLWNATQKSPFPPLVKTNLGREKIKAYPGGSKKIGNVNFLGMHSELFQIGHFLAWLESQVSWQDELKAQIQAQLPPDVTPERIMLVDDWIAEGNTFILALGLLDIIYPDAEKHFVAGDLSWKRGFERFWLERFHPQIFERLERSQTEGGFSEDDRRAFETRINRLVPGTEDVNPNSFDWRPVTVSSPVILCLESYLPAEEWLDLPRFVQETIERFVEERIQEYQRGMLDDYSLTSLQERGFYPKLRQDTLILRDLWLKEESITRRQIIEKYKLTPGKASRLLRSMLRRDLLERHGRGGGTFYRLPPDAYPPASS